MEGGSSDPVYAEDHTANAAHFPIRRFKFISPGYFAAIGGPPDRWTRADLAETYSQTPVALISENVARELWNDPRAAIGKRIRPTLKDDWREVIGGSR